MRKTIFFTLALSFATMGIFAQSANADAPMTRNAPLSPAERAQQAADKMTAEAKLSSDQSAKILPVLNDYYTKAAQIRKADNRQHLPETKTKMDALKQDLYTKLQGTLTANQLNTVKAMYEKPAK